MAVSPPSPESTSTREGCQVQRNSRRKRQDLGHLDGAAGSARATTWHRVAGLGADIDGVGGTSDAGAPWIAPGVVALRSSGIL